jgi:hypothetical protein
MKADSAGLMVAGKDTNFQQFDAYCIFMALLGTDYGGQRMHG